jgi:hypothetical protein
MDPSRLPSLTAALGALLLAALPFASASAQDVGQIKVAKGSVHIERGGQRLAAGVGARVRQSDVVVTGADGAVGIAFLDDSLLSAGPRSVLVIERFAFDSTTHQGAFETALRSGTLTAVSGKIARQSPEAMKVRTPAAVLGVRGTEFAVRTSDARD